MIPGCVQDTSYGGSWGASDFRENGERTSNHGCDDPHATPPSQLPVSAMATVSDALHWNLPTSFVATRPYDGLDQFAIMILGG